MISILIRETLIELPGKEKKVVDRLPIMTADSMDLIQAYCDKKGFKCASGSGVNSIFRRDLNLDSLKKEYKDFFDIKTPIRIEERFIIMEMELVGGEK